MSPRPGALGAHAERDGALGAARAEWRGALGAHAERDGASALRLHESYGELRVAPAVGRIGLLASLRSPARGHPSQQRHVPELKSHRQCSVLLPVMACATSAVECSLSIQRARIAPTKMILRLPLKLDNPQQHLWHGAR